MTWEDAKVVDKYPKDSFSAKVLAAGVKPSAKQGTPMLEFEFDTEQVLDIYLDKVQDDFTMDGKTAPGKLIKSLEALGIKTQFERTNNFLTGVRFVPDLTGRVVSFVAEKRTWTKQDGTSKELTDWTVGDVEGAPAPKAERTSSPPPAAGIDGLAAEWKVLLAENLEAGVTYDEGEVVKLLGTWVLDKTKKANLNKVRGAAFKGLFADGFLKGSLSGFTLG